MTPNNHLDIILRIIESLRLEIFELEKAMHRAFFVVLTVSVVFAGIYFDDKIIKDDTVRGVLLFGLSQILFLLVLFAGACFINLTVHAGHLRSLENQGNKIIGAPLLIWESEISRRFLFSYHGSFFWACLILYLCVFGSFSFLMAATLDYTKNFGFSVLIVLELLVSIGLAIFAHFELKRVEIFSNKKFESYFSDKN